MNRSLQGLVFVACIAASQLAWSQYKYVGPDGRVTYSDQPPPSGTRVLDQKKAGGGTTTSTPLPYALQQAQAQFPVTIYTGNSCLPCEDARVYLRNRGVPFAEKTVTSNDDLVLFRQLSADGTAPVLTVGTRRSVGFSQVAWSGLLDDAGYPQTSVLPRDYQNATASPLSPNTRPANQTLGVSDASSTNAAAPQARRGTASVPGGGVPAAQPATLPATTPPGFRF